MTNPDTRPDSVGQAHTPTPWIAESADMFGDHNIVLADSREDARAIAAVVSNMRPPEEVAANARFIVHAVNCHDELLEALEAIIADCGEVMMDGYVENSIHSREVALAKSAIAKAKGGQP